MRTSTPLLTLAAALLATAPAQDLTDGMIAYWPLDELIDGKTPDIAGNSDMDAVNLMGSDVVTGRWGNAFNFVTDRNTLLQRISAPGDALPLAQYNDFTISIWVQGDGTDQPDGDLRVFSEGSNQNNNPLFNIGTTNNRSSDAVDIYMRGNNGTLNHAHTEAMAFVANEWHHIVWVQTGSDFVIYVDGAQTNALLNSVPQTTRGRPLVNPGQPYSVNTTTIGGILRSAASHWFTGLIDDVACWDRSLSAAEVSELFTNGTPDPGDVQGPLEIRRFDAERLQVAEGDTVMLEWEGSDDATFAIDQGVGNVDAETSVLGAGRILVPVSAPTTFTLTATREDETVTASVSVAVLPGVSAGWSLLDTFSGYDNGLVAEEAAPFWLNPDATPGWSVATVDVDNGVLQCAAGQQTLFTRLGRFDVVDGASRSAYFHVRTDSSTSGLEYRIGLTNKALRGFVEDTNNNLGGYLNIVRAEGSATALVSAGNGEFNVPQYALQPDTWYRVWIDVTNSAGDADDVISAYIMEDGEFERTALFENSIGDRGNTNDLIYFFVAAKAGNTADSSLQIDNVFVSQDGTLDTDPLGRGGSTFMITEVSRSPDGTVHLEWNGSATRFWALFESSDGENWFEVEDSLSGNEADVVISGDTKLLRLAEPQ